MSYQDEPTAFSSARLLGDVVQERFKVLELQHQGHYSDAGQVADNLLTQLSEALPASGFGNLDAGQAPLAMQGLALLADSTYSALATGDTAGAAERLRVMGHFTERLGLLADQVAGMGMLYCLHGRPSLDGGCLQIPPCE